MRFNSGILNKTYGYVTPSKSNFKIERLKSNGRKLHFIRQGGEAGKDLVSKTAAEHGVSLHDASVMLSQIKISVEYSKPSLYPIYVKAENYGQISLKVRRRV